MGEGISMVQEWSILFGYRVLAAVLILVIGRFVAAALRRLVKKFLDKGSLDKTLVSFTSSAVYVFLMLFVVIAAISQLGVETASLIAMVGAAGLAVGFALQGSLANFASGVLLAVFKPFRSGDFIEGGGVAGIVENIGFFTTELKSPDNKKIIVPNAKLSSDSIINYSAKEQRRVDIIAGVSYGDDIDKVRKVLEDIVSSDARILKDPAPKIALMELGESSVNFIVRPWVNTSDYWDVFFYLQEQIKKRFDSEGITIPFPQRDVHLYNEKELPK